MSPSFANEPMCALRMIYGETRRDRLPDLRAPFDAAIGRAAYAQPVAFGLGNQWRIRRYGAEHPGHRSGTACNGCNACLRILPRRRLTGGDPRLRLASGDKCRLTSCQPWQSREGRTLFFGPGRHKPPVVATAIQGGGDVGLLDWNWCQRG